MLALDPNNTRARAEIARAYLALGETQTAQQEFETVKRQGVPADVSMTIDRYIAAARRIEDQNATLITGYMEASVGYDTNVDVGPNKSSVAIPGFGGFRSSSARQQGECRLVRLGRRRRQREDAAGRWLPVAGRTLGERARQFRQAAVRHAERRLQRRCHAYRRTGCLYGHGAGGCLLRRQWPLPELYGVTGQWQRNLDARNQVGAFLQYSDLQYPTQDVRDANRWVGGASYAHLYREG